MNRINQTLECYRLVDNYFKGNWNKVSEWFRTPNPLLGDQTPDLMMSMGREDKLLKFIKTQLDGENA